jgi:hypothetical protein
MDIKDRENKLSIDELVEIGDYLHETDCAVVFVNRRTEDGKNKTLCCIKGNGDKVCEMLFETLIKDERVSELLIQASAMAAIHNMREMFKGDK